MDKNGLTDRRGAWHCGNFEENALDEVLTKQGWCQNEMKNFYEIYRRNLYQKYITTLANATLLNSVCVYFDYLYR